MTRWSRAGGQGRPRGQALIEFALVLPVLLLLLLGALDFGRLMQAHVTATSAVRAGAFWGAANFQNATQDLGPSYGSGGCGPTCNIEYRSCKEASGLPGYSGGQTYDWPGDAAAVTCTSGSAANVCSAGATQSNPYLVVRWYGPDGTTPLTGQAQSGDIIEVDGTFCFQTFFPVPAIAHQLTWTSSARYVIQP